MRAVCGGSWATAANDVVIDYREGRNPAMTYETVGFRVVLPLGAITDDAE